jgi:hypothetical protein
LALAGVVRIGQVWPWRRQRSEPHCHARDDDLTGGTSGRCPACGTDVTPAFALHLLHPTSATPAKTPLAGAP